MSELPIVEHDSSRTGRWFRERRLRLAVWIAVIEGILVVLHVIPKWLAILVAIAVLAWYFLSGREARSVSVRQVGWVAAVSQAAILLIPVVAFFVTTLSLIALGVLAAVALLVLFTERH
jgi:hypothetical protein